jgi:hypothetical protein
MKCRRSVLLLNAFAFTAICVLHSAAYRPPLAIDIDSPSTVMIQKGSTRIHLVSIEQLRAARGLLGWSQTELASRAGLSLPTVKRLEGRFGPKVSDEVRVRLREAIEAAGIEFIDENGGGAGVRFRKAKTKKKNTEAG